jgi:hypothetical protein
MQTLALSFMRLRMALIKGRLKFSQCLRVSLIYKMPAPKVIPEGYPGTSREGFQLGKHGRTHGSKGIITKRELSEVEIDAKEEPGDAVRAPLATPVKSGVAIGDTGGEGSINQSSSLLTRPIAALLYRSLSTKIP